MAGESHCSMAQQPGKAVFASIRESQKWKDKALCAALSQLVQKQDEKLKLIRFTPLSALQNRFNICLLDSMLSKNFLAAVSNGNRLDTTCEEWVDAEEVHLLAEETKDLPARLGCVTS